VTLGQESGENWPHGEAVGAARALGAQIELKNVNEICVDKKNRVVTTPAFMYGTTQYHLIYDGIGNLVQAMDQLIKNK